MNEQGAFQIDIIVWQKPDWIQIRNFLANMKNADPTNKTIADAFADAERYAAVAVAEVKAVKEIEETRQQIADLKKETPKDQKEAEKSVPEIKPSPVPEATAEVASTNEKVAQL